MELMAVMVLKWTSRLRCTFDAPRDEDDSTRFGNQL